jgi:hypothetical protein
MKHPRSSRFTKPHNPTGNLRALASSTVEKLIHGVSVAEQITHDRQQARIAEFEALSKAAQQQQLEEKYDLRTQQQQEKDMAGLRESLESAMAEKAARAAALSATLEEWGDDEDAPAPAAVTPTKEPITMTQQTSTLSVSEGTFNFVRNNPNNTARYIVERLFVLYGYNTASTTSLISQMVKQGRVGRENGVLVALYETYSPIKASKQAVKVEHKQVKIVVKGQDITAPAGGIATLAKPPVAHSISNLLDNISVNEARALYLELKKLFGGN